MKFETLEDRPKTEYKTFERPLYLNLDFGKHIIRLLTEQTRIWTHFLRGKGGTKGIGVTIRCLGTECPICQNNKVIKMSNPDNFRDVQGYNPSSPRYYFNVLDRTPVKVCPQCQTENKQDLAGNFPTICKSCQTLIMEVEPLPSDKVKLLNLSDTNVGELKIINDSKRDKDGEVIGCENYDLEIYVTKVGGKKKPFIQPTDSMDVVEIPAEFLWDVNKAVISLETDEILALVNGVSLKDIFAARRGETNEFETAIEQNIAEVDEKINQLFGN